MYHFSRLQVTFRRLVLRVDDCEVHRGEESHSIYQKNSARSVFKGALFRLSSQSVDDGCKVDHWASRDNYLIKCTLYFCLIYLYVDHGKSYSGDCISKFYNLLFDKYHVGNRLSYRTPENFSNKGPTSPGLYNTCHLICNGLTIIAAAERMS